MNLRYFVQLLLVSLVLGQAHSTNQALSTPISKNCSSTDNLDELTQEQFVTILSEPCRYDKLIKPDTADEPLPVHVQIDLSHIESSDQVQFRAHVLVQYQYNDNRLSYEKISPKRTIVMGEQSLREMIWLPHIVVKNERETTVQGFDGKDVVVMITPQGDVVYSSRMVITFYCWMDLKKFPFDHQDCYLRWSSWSYNTDDLVLHWDEDLAVKVAKNLHLTEFIMTDTWTNETTVTLPFTKGALVGNFSELVFKFRLAREVGYYIMEYFLPSILLVCTSWVTFWLQADAGPPRATLGSSTVLAFITLNAGLIKDLPKVSYIKASDIWFLACSCFIFGSLAEFAFVNVIWRRKKTVELKRPSSKHIIKGAFTPSLARSQLRKAESIYNLHKSKSCTSVSEKIEHDYITIHGYPGTYSNNYSQDDLVVSDGSTTTIQVPDQYQKQTWHTMSPQDVAIWVDRKSRIVFPVVFIIFNAFYWSFVYIL